MLYSRFAVAALSLACLFPLAATAQTATPPTPATPPATAAAPATAPGAAAPVDNTPVTHAEFQALVKQAIMNDPDMIMQGVQKLREKQMKETQDKAKDALEKYRADLFNDPSSPSTGDAKTADVTLVEFFDYHCGYCKRFLTSVLQLTKEDKKVRIVFKEFPILSEDSVVASRAALAVNHIAPEKYYEYHQALMQMNGKFDEKNLTEAAKKIGVNTKKFKEEMSDKAITDALDKNRKMAADLGIHGTPGIVTTAGVVPGALPYEELKKMVDELRSGKKPSVMTDDTEPKS